ncbi:PREDICTED: uncharacterized protein LOC106811071 [Priapulus caudatus]|uniref:Uncharacterized protein LOC106811071 n=1 Tax=Priapulus caudatus TaxID=37621 RepID=A0ABM1ED12_PRICU|nr:PREDICTED: uncharacterized protein LOC106811071 [Priapulus caudatus]
MKTIAFICLLAYMTAAQKAPPVPVSRGVAVQELPVQEVPQVQPGSLFVRQTDGGISTLDFQELARNQALPRGSNARDRFETSRRTFQGVASGTINAGASSDAARAGGGFREQGGARAGEERGGARAEGGFRERGGARAEGGFRERGGAKIEGGFRERGGARAEGGFRERGGAKIEGGFRERGGARAEGGFREVGGRGRGRFLVQPEDESRPVPLRALSEDDVVAGFSISSSVKKDQSNLQDFNPYTTRQPRPLPKHRPQPPTAATRKTPNHGKAKKIAIAQTLANRGRDPVLFPQPDPANEILDVAVECDMERNRMSVTLTFERDFAGLIYTKNSFKVNGCRKVASPSRFQRFDINLDTCGMDENLSTDNFGGTATFSNTVIIMNERELGVLEMWDKAFRVTCDFAGEQREKAVDFGLKIPELGAEAVLGGMDLPTCRMKVVNGDNPMAPGTNNLLLGDIASLVVYIQDSTHFDIFVSNCYAHDGMDMGRIDLIDEDGCPTHRKLIGYQQHTTELLPGDTLVYAYLKSFKFPDVKNVFFDCQCTICMENCFQPQCDGRRTKRDLEQDGGSHVAANSRTFQSIRISLPEDINFNVTRSSHHQMASEEEKQTAMCISKTGFGVGMAVFLAVLVVIVLVASFFGYRHVHLPAKLVA